ncbi:hypothetical protein HK104_008180 [Borealophlyctis nickersoniae]|nr:hypothetical protein HK104_008180 [Borealophlyctis nickersoniae]
METNKGNNPGTAAIVFNAYKFILLVILLLAILMVYATVMAIRDFVVDEFGSSHSRDHSFLPKPKKREKDRGRPLDLPFESHPLLERFVLTPPMFLYIGTRGVVYAFLVAIRWCVVNLWKIAPIVGRQVWDGAKHYGLATGKWFVEWIGVPLVEMLTPIWQSTVEVGKKVGHYGAYDLLPRLWRQLCDMGIVFGGWGRVLGGWLLQGGRHLWQGCQFVSERVAYPAARLGKRVIVWSLPPLRSFIEVSKPVVLSAVISAAMWLQWAGTGTVQFLARAVTITNARIIQPCVHAAATIGKELAHQIQHYASIVAPYIAQFLTSSAYYIILMYRTLSPLIQELTTLTISTLRALIQIATPIFTALYGFSHRIGLWILLFQIIPSALDFLFKHFEILLSYVVQGAWRLTLYIHSKADPIFKALVPLITMALASAAKWLDQIEVVRTLAVWCQRQWEVIMVHMRAVEAEWLRVMDLFWRRVERAQVEASKMYSLLLVRLQEVSSSAVHQKAT